MTKKTLVLMGIKHCGKSTQGKLLAKHFNCDFYDSDDVITDLTGNTPREIYSQKGKEAFAEAEHNACKYITEKIADNFSVVATGGGICNNEPALKELHKNGVFIFLNSDEETACNRIIKEIEIHEDGSMKNLPAYIAKSNPKTIDDIRASFHNFYVERQKIYNSICDVKIEMKPVSKQENLKQIVAELAKLS